MRAAHHLHGVLDMTPLFGFFAIALAFASHGILGRLGDGLQAVFLQHLPRDRVNLHFGHHVTLLMFRHLQPRESTVSLLCGAYQTAEPEFSFRMLPDTIFRLSRARPPRRSQDESVRGSALRTAGE